MLSKCIFIILINHDSRFKRLVYTKRENLILALLFFSLIGASLGLSLYYSENIPLLDDYNLCLKLIADFAEEDSWLNQVLSVFAFKNGHPTVTQNVMFLFEWMLFNSVDFRHFILINNI